MVRSQLLKSAAFGIAAVAMVGVAAQADVLQVQNLTFNQFNPGPNATPKNNFSAVNPAFWYRGQPAGIADLVYIDAPGTANSNVGGYPTFLPNNPPPGGNFVQADGNPDYQSIFKQDISGLIADTDYTLSFWQAASQDSECCYGPTTEQWRVFLGDGNVTLNSPGGPGVYTVNSAGNVEADSPLMTTAAFGYTDWQYITLLFHTPIGSPATQTLSFLAWGDNGSNANLPPTLFLAGVNTPTGIPEPATLSLFGAGIAGAWLRRRAKRKV
jgi:PEP-CTERM motif